MPEGIGVELLIFAALIAIVGAVLFLARRGVSDRRPTEVPPPAPAEDKTATEAEAASETAVDRPGAATDVVERAVEEPAPEAVRPSLRDRLTKSRKFISGRLADAFHGAPDDETWDDVEAALIQADVGPELATKIVADLRDTVREHRATTFEDV